MLFDQDKAGDDLPEVERPSRQSAGDWFGVFLRGLAMGVVEVVPGVSGGTLALITGIYRELMASLASFLPASIAWCFTDPKRFWRHHNLSFLACLGVGMGIGVLAFANLMSHWLKTAPSLVWAFFFGLILWSTFYIGRERKGLSLATFGVAGVLCGILASQIEPFAAEPAAAVLFMGGALAVGAWLLPAISGSFVLLCLGLYEVVLNAIASFNLVPLSIFCLGCVAGIALFSRLYGLLLRHYFEPSMSFFTGLMAGSLVRLWPWRFEGELLTPSDWSLATGAPANSALVLAMMLAGIGALWLLTRRRI